MFWEKTELLLDEMADLRCTLSCAVMKYVRPFIRISCVGFWPFNIIARDYFAITLLLK